MELPELQQGLQNIQQANTPTEVMPPAEAPAPAEKAAVSTQGYPCPA